MSTHSTLLLTSKIHSLFTRFCKLYIHNQRTRSKRNNPKTKEIFVRGFRLDSQRFFRVGIIKEKINTGMINSYNWAILFGALKSVQTITYFAICSNIKTEILLVWQPRQHICRHLPRIFRGKSAGPRRKNKSSFGFEIWNSNPGECPRERLPNHGWHCILPQSATLTVIRLMLAGNVFFELPFQLCKCEPSCRIDGQTSTVCVEREGEVGRAQSES